MANPNASYLQTYFLDSKETIAQSKNVFVDGRIRAYQLIVRGNGVVAAEATVYGSTEPNGPWVSMITLNATGTDTGSADGETTRMWRYTYAALTTLTGDSALATLHVEG